MTPAVISALGAAVVAVVGALTALVRQFQHANDTSAHPPAKAPAPKGTVPPAAP